ncbi:glycosyl transferase-like UDP-glucuronosyltransferase [Sphingomonas sp. 1P06PA]|uniref:glycosyl transferase-like UDP-glucuronosyltransferase n=1 Tax=Sphingomonas sp. 1P06PA TaxID=554121 RepID=UPI0039A7378E
MARILIGWELGSGSGHVTKLTMILAELRARGYDVTIAAQDIARWPADIPVWQAPLWPQQIVPLHRPNIVTPNTMGDILVAMGLADRPALTAMIAAWDRIIAAVDPALVISEYAPGLLLAAHGRVPTLSLGTGFSLPPPEHPVFASLTGKPAVHEEAPLLDGLNRALSANGRPGRDRLPGIFSADRQIVAAFEELDPYRGWRLEPAGVPHVGPVPLADSSGDELFVYMNGSQPRTPAFFDGLVRSGLPVRLYDARLLASDRMVLERAGITVETAPVPWTKIAARSRMVMSHCGLGFSASALLAGLPHILVPYDIEKGMIAAAVEQLELGVIARFATMTADGFASTLADAWSNTALFHRTTAAAPRFRSRMTRGVAIQTADLAAATIAGTDI